ncbi:16S rRNA (guanine(966)-N(2))-methyltransferase RsmD [Candidatus Vidania fulgoroideorum]
MKRNSKIRIISGKYKNSLIKFPNKLKIKPTKSIIKKSLFEVIKKKIKNSCFLDLFAGSGGLGFEALSRGAKKVYFVDNKYKIIKCLKKNINNIKIKKKFVKIIKKCSISFLNKNKKKFDVILLDPPYFLYNKKINYILKLCKNNLKKKGIIYLENFKNNKLNLKNNNITKVGKKGKIIYYIINN